MTDTQARPVRMCDLCGAVDDHPRHVVGYDGSGAGVSRAEIIKKVLREGINDETFDLLLAQTQDGMTKFFHMDCCREAGCPDGTCNVVTQGAEDKRGADLTKHLTKES